MIVINSKMKEIRFINIFVFYKKIYLYFIRKSIFNDFFYLLIILI